ncbi:MAG: hypothetical protein HOE48_03950, partial [Candidatus Latescibacteria bacterium]|nr:hypothetical protein [Candidatus Latescibacterota bacterium]
MSKSPKHIPPVSPLKACFILVVVGIAVYANGLNGPFVFDDIDQILENTSIRTIWPPTWFTQAHSPTMGIHGRVFTSLTLALNHHFGGTEVTGYHVVNLFIHILASVGLFCSVQLLLQSKRLSKQYANFSDKLALAIALIWLVHPLQTECVNYVLQRSESIMGLCYLITLYSAIRSINEPRYQVWWLAAIVFCTLGMLSKEVMVSAPIMVILADRSFYFETFQQAFQRRWKFYVGLASTWVILAWALWHKPHGNTIGFISSITPWDYAKNQCHMLLTYLKLSVWPHPLLLDYGTPSPGLALLDIAPAGIIVLALLIGTGMALKYNSLIGFIGAWFFLILAPTSSFIPITTEVGAERRMYLPLAAIIALLVILGHRAAQHVLQNYLSHNLSPFLRRWIGLIFACCIVCGLAARSMKRNQDYQSKETIWQTVVTHAPQNARGWNNLGHVWTQRNHMAKSLSFFEQAIILKPDYVQAHYNI